MSPTNKMALMPLYFSQKNHVSGLIMMKSNSVTDMASKMAAKGFRK